jgi:hypothetical protein
MRRVPVAPFRPDLETARGFLAFLTDAVTGGARRTSDPSQGPAFARWLISQQLGPLAYHVLPRDAALAAALAGNALGVAASSLSHGEILDRVETDLAEAGIPLVLLKGAAVAGAAWGDPALRAMSDLDAWIREEDLPRATERLRAMGFVEVELNPHRPRELKRLARVEIQLRLPGREHVLVELHASPFKGFWAQRAAAVDEAGIRERTVAVGPGRHARALAPEDQVLHLAFHLAAGQFVAAPLRGLLDIALVARTTAVDWETVAERAAQWRLATLTWTVLDLAERLIGVPGVAEVLSRRRPSAARRALLRRIVTPESILEAKNWFRLRARYVLLLLLVDRPPDMARLVLRTVWPERAWIAARYGRPASRLGHVWRLVRHGET